MEEKKVKVIVECPDGEIRKHEGKALVGFVMDTDRYEDGNPIDTGIFVGSGNIEDLLIRAATSLGEMVRQAVKGKFSQVLISGVMAKKLIRAAAGDSEDYDTIFAENRTRKMEEEEA